MRRFIALTLLVSLSLCGTTFAADPATKTAEHKAAGRAKAQAKQERKDAAAAKLHPTHPDVAYGPHERNVLDFYQAKSDKPTPLIVYIHGGGFVGGDKKTLSADMVETANAKGISVAALNYRFVDGKDVIFPVPQHDSVRALQFLRSKAKEWNIDSKRVACYGGSAGAGISMYIGFHDEMAKPQSDDPIERESTRIVAIGTLGGQGTYDPIEIKKLIGGRAWEHPSIFKIYGNTTIEEALNPTPEKKKLYDEGSAITHLTKDDPPLLMYYSEADGPLPADAGPGRGIHHPNFGRQLKAKMDELGIENELVYLPEQRVRRNSVEEMVAFFQKQFEKVK